VTVISCFTSVSTEVFFLIFLDFLSGALTASEELGAQMEIIQIAASKLAKHFCEDEEKFQLNECFALFSDFLLKTQNTIKVK